MNTPVFMERKKVYDPILRLIHAWNGLAILFLLCTGLFHGFLREGLDRHTLWKLHIWVGYGLLGGLVVRAGWALLGPRDARMSALWHPERWQQAIRHFRFPRHEGYGHHPMASGLYLLVYLILFGMAVTGLLLAGVEQDLGPFATSLYDHVWLKPLLKEPHELGSYFLAAFTCIHLGALIWHERREGTPLAQAMISGYQYQLKTRTEDQSHETRP